ncbi:MAG: ubiquinone/menaquinone biosynthesis methyltransferase [Verrucomicrobia bacterium]|jgi:demethylmenaquinone methyltransferase/2-methoxy-6-polyprenyl-1,4-benzoquinol methylase|nr:ubiquinone/menaquinone biosynthesis methyltransferase [Verrucomicrobiota bacterium]
MSNRFQAKGADRAARVGELFGLIASRYDQLNDIQTLGLHRRWKRRLVSLAALKPGERALDVCCGTGDITRRLAESGADVTGLDFSPEMLAVARRRCGLTASLRFVQGDAMRLPFGDGEFAAVTVGYGLRNLVDWRTGLSEMVRVAAPGGRILVLEFGKPANRWLCGLYFLYLRLMVPVLGLLFCGNAAAYAYILDSLREYPAQSGVADGMRSLGLQEVQVHDLLGGMMSIQSGVKP